MRRLARSIPSLLCVALLGCPIDPNGTASATETDTGDPELPGEVDWPTLECDPLVPSYCGFPFPSNVFTAADPDSPTGRRLALSATLIPDSAGAPPAAPDLWNRSDGFSPGLPAMTHMPGATVDGLPDLHSISASLAPGSPTVLLDAETGERVPHFAELDRSHADAARRALMIRPVVRLADGRRYIVALRDVVDAGGTRLDPSPAFRALRDGEDFDDPSIEARRGLYADIFARLAGAGVAREDLQLAWDFTTASRENNTAALLKMRDEALALVGEGGPNYMITRIDSAHPDPHVALYVEGKLEVPLYLDAPGPGAHLVTGADGLPQQSGTAEVDFTLIVPPSAFTSPAAALQYGHGLLGSGRAELLDPARAAFAAQYNYALFAVDWLGMAQDDAPSIAAFVEKGDLEQFQSLVDRLHQGVLNALLAMRTVSGALAQDPTLQHDGAPLIDAGARYYHGDDQGGILGATYMALSTDVARGVLGVPGQPYNLLLGRGADLGELFAPLQGAFPDGLDRQLALALLQILWDRAEPDGYSRYIRTDNLPGTPPKEVLLEVAIGDHQVTTFGAHVMARAIGGVVNLEPTNRSVWGLQAAPAPHAGSALVEYDFGLAPAPTINVPATDGDDPHDKLLGLASVAKMRDQFLRSGVVETFCDGPCDPE